MLLFFFFFLNDYKFYIVRFPLDINIGDLHTSNSAELTKMNSLMDICLPPSTIIFYTSYTRADDSLQHLELIFDTATAATVITHLQVDPGTCPLLRRESIGRNNCRKDHCNWCVSEKFSEKAALAPAPAPAAPDMTCQHPAEKLITIPNGGSLSASRPGGGTRPGTNPNETPLGPRRYPIMTIYSRKPFCTTCSSCSCPFQTLCNTRGITSSYFEYTANTPRKHFSAAPAPSC